MTTKELYTKDAKVWVEHPTQVWEGATVISDYRSGVLIVKIDQTGEIRQIKITDENKLPPLRNPSLLIGQNDLTSLSYLHEPAVLHNLKVRFCDRNAIYTYCGIVLVAINPYYDLPIYGDETIMAYRGQSMGDLDPHIFAVSEEAYTKLERERRDQSIIVSGESGAGKTVSAKYAMRYFAAVRGNVSETQVERKVLASSPIMEAIGNAKTTRNDNSSRFGKFIEIHFDPEYRICGASMRTYLLEKSRVTYQSAGERNYHIFYQLCAAARQMPDLKLDHQDCFHYLNQGGSPEIDGVDDLKAFTETKTALTTLGVTESEQQNMFTVLAAILHLGNVELNSSEEDAEGAYIDSDDTNLLTVCSLLGISNLELSRWLTHRRIASAHEVIVSRMDTQRAAFARDALAKRMYGELFAWLVKAVNRALDTGHAKKHFVGVLDIYGFETFEINSFEQFCINYANEKLQQQFNSHVFKLEQDEYIKEEISWKMIDFYDNQPCIDLIEDRLGVLALLDEECRVPQGSDQGFVAKLHDKCAKYPHFLKPRFGNAAFIIKHFADNVEYQCGGFLEKNRDTVLEEQLECIKSATCCRLIHVIFAESPADHSATLPPPSRRRTTPSMPLGSLTQPPRRASGQKQTVGAQFRASLFALMGTLSATTPHYVRCIKPNDSKTAFQFDPARAVNQLRACGVLETIRISSAGFLSRWLYHDFFQRYRLLCCSKDIDRSNIKATCSKILLKHVKDTDKYQFGATKIFFRAGQVAYLEKVRADLQRLYCVRVQSCVRGFLARRRYMRLTRVKCQEIRRNRAAIKIQKTVRGWLARLKYQRLRKLAIGIQAHARGYMARKLYKNKKILKLTIGMQRYARGYLVRREMKIKLRKIIVVQAAIRGYLARRLYKRLRIEARSLDHVKSLNKGLENKIISLQQRLEDAQGKAKKVEPLLAQIAELRAKLETLKLIEIEAKTLKVDIHSKDNLLNDLRVELAEEKESNKRHLEEKKEIEFRYKKEKETWQKEREKLESELNTNKEHFEMAIEERDKLHEAEKKALCQELENERQSRQKLLSSQYDLQERLDNLHRAPSKDHKRSLSDATTNSQQETTVEDDFGYGSVRATEAPRPALEAVNWSTNNSSQNGPMATADAGLVLRMRNRISVPQSELSRKAKRTADLEDRLTNSSIPQNNTSTTLEVKPVMRKKEREYLGMFEYKLQDEGVIVKKLILDLRPRVAVTLLPGLPAYILFMMILHTDHVVDEPKMHGLIRAIRLAVRKTLKRRAESVEYNALWLSNILRLINNLRQYSGDAMYQESNTPRQNQQSLRIFDLSEYRQVLSDLAIGIYQGLITLLQRNLENLIVKAILEYEEISGLFGPAKAPAPSLPSTGPARLKHELATTHDYLKVHAVDTPLRVTIFKQLFYYICAYSLNQLLLRKDLCCWAKALQIRYNISHLETWIKDHLAEYGQKNMEEILSVLKPITQAVQLLQARKSMADVSSTVEMCADLSAMQVCKILNMYTPAEDYEVKVTKEFIHEIQKLMQERDGPNANKKPQSLLMDTKMIYAVQFDFCPSPIRLEDIEVPEVLELGGLLTKI